VTEDSLQPSNGANSEAQVTIPAELGFMQLVWSDYLFHNADDGESIKHAALLFLPRMLLNPSLQLALTVRIAQCGPSFLTPIVRWLQVVLFSSEIYYFKSDNPIRIGPAINFPHPICVLIGPGSEIGSNVAIYNNTEIGSDRPGVPAKLDRSRISRIGDNATILPYATILGPFTVGHDAMVGLGVILNEDVPPGSLKTQRHLKPPGAWRDPRVAGPEG
jgi:serine O-acetyltransferase